MEPKNDTSRKTIKSRPEYDILIEGDTLIGGKTWKKVYFNMECANKDAGGLAYYTAVAVRASVQKVVFSIMEKVIAQ